MCQLTRSASAMSSDSSCGERRAAAMRCSSASSGLLNDRSDASSAPAASAIAFCRDAHTDPNQLRF